MATTTDGATAAPPAQTDLYALRAEDARPAPETFRGRLRYRPRARAVRCRRRLR